MAKRGPMSAEQKAAISAGLKRYWAGKRGGSGGSSSHAPTDRGGTISREEAAARMFGTADAARRIAKAKAPKRKSATSSKPPKVAQLGKPVPIQNISTGKPISRAEAAARMFGSAKSHATGKKARRAR